MTLDEMKADAVSYQQAPRNPKSADPLSEFFLLDQKIATVNAIPEHDLHCLTNCDEHGDIHVQCSESGPVCQYHSEVVSGNDGIHEYSHGYYSYECTDGRWYRKDFYDEDSVTGPSYSHSYTYTNYIGTKVSHWLTYDEFTCMKVDRTEALYVDATGETQLIRNSVCKPGSYEFVERWIYPDGSWEQYQTETYEETGYFSEYYHKQWADGSYVVWQYSSTPAGWEYYYHCLDHSTAEWLRYTAYSVSTGGYDVVYIDSTGEEWTKHCEDHATCHTSELN